VKLVVLMRSPRRGPRSSESLPGLAPAERAALNTAIALAGAYDDASIIALAAGPATHDAALQLALEAGVDRAVRIIDPIISDMDLRTTASVLSAAIHQLGFDLVLTGSRSADWGSGATGPAVAHLLGVPHVTSVLHAERSEDRLRLAHRRGGRLYRLLVTLPALITITTGPQAPASHGRSSGAQPIERLSLADMTLPFSIGRDARELDLSEARVPSTALEGVSSLFRVVTRLER
jgi:electron transfer flavoprotein beta subunit